MVPKMEEVIEGPDLNAGRSRVDKKNYRQFLLHNGLRVVIVSDTLIMGQHDMGVINDGSDSESDMSNESDQDSDGDHSFGDEEDGIRKAAAAMVVRAGSFHDPLCCQGMAHFLEHMLFMGTKKYPSENEYSSFIEKHGGSDNAFTELEYTLYHFDIAQEKLFEGIDRFAQFFISPLLREDSKGRELNAIESEFKLSQNSDDCRLQQLMCHTGKAAEEHPFGKFSWGNLRSLKEIPEKNDVNLSSELKTFYDQFYYAQNMRLVVIGAYSLDELQSQVVKKFSGVPALPREPSPLNIQLEDAVTWNETSHSPIEDFGMPLDPSLGKIYRIVPVKEKHNLTITWQLPPQRNWKSKPADYVAHLLGHEASGSLLSSLKARSWANTCYAGIDSGGHENASSHALFSFNLVLSEEGVSHWVEIISLVYTYIGMVRYYCHSDKGLPSCIYDELKAVHEMAYAFADEMTPEELVEDIAEDAICSYLPPERLLDGNSLLYEFDGDAIKHLLDQYFCVENARIDLVSSLFGRECDFDEAVEEQKQTNAVASQVHFMAGDSNVPLSAGDAAKEPHFGTRFWCHDVSQVDLSKWKKLCEPQLAPPSSLVGLPPLNPYIPTRFDLKPLPDDDNDHPLLNCSLKLCIIIGRKKSWFPATVIKYDKKKGGVLLSFEDQDEKWHKVDDTKDALTNVKRGFEGTFDRKAIKYKVIAVPKEGEGAIMRFGDESDYHVEDGISFPAIPPPSLEERLPRLISNTKGVKLFHLQDRKFKRPTAELRLKIVCSGANKSPLHRACADLYSSLCMDALTETCYLASTCELGSSLRVCDVGFTLRVCGFDHKLMTLTQEILDVFFSFRKNEAGHGILPFNTERYEQCLEMLMRRYQNAGMHASSFCTTIRLRCLCPSIWSAGAKADAVRDITPDSFRSIISGLLSQVSIEGLYHGNVTLSDAKEAEKVMKLAISSAGSSILAKKKFPRQHVLKIPLREEHGGIIVPTKDANEPNTAVEVYFQIGSDDIRIRVLVDLLTSIMYDSLFDQLRTKDQFGYQVSCEERWTYGIVGMCIKVVTNCKSAEETSRRIDQFLLEYRDTIASMDNEEYMEHLVGLAKNKLEMFNSLEEECDHYWNECVEGRYEWEVHRNEALCLRTITKDDLLHAYDEWLLPQSSSGKANKRRRVIIHVIGTGEGDASNGRPDVEAGRVDAEADQRILNFHKCSGEAFWN